MLNIARSPAVKLPKLAARSVAKTFASKPKRSARQPAARGTDKVLKRIHRGELGTFAPWTEPSLWILVDLSSGMRRTLNELASSNAREDSLHH